MKKMVLILIITLVSSFSSFAATSNKLCEFTRNHYLDDANMLAGLLDDMANVTKLSQPTLANKFVTAKNNIITNPRFPSLKGTYDYINTVIVPSMNAETKTATQGYLAQFHEQLISASKREKVWKRNNCREKKGCLLGQPNSYCSWQVKK